MTDSTIAFIGLGLIGGSIARGIKRANPDTTIMAYMRTRSKLEQAKFAPSEDTRRGLVDVANLFQAKVVDVGADNLMLELTGEPRTIDAFIRLVKPYGIQKLVRTGITALARG